MSGAWEPKPVIGRSGKPIQRGGDFYLYLIGDRSFMLNSEGIGLMRRAAVYGTPLESAQKAAAYFSPESVERYTRRMRENLERSIAELVVQGINFRPLTKGAAGILAMADLVRDALPAGLMRKMETALHMMTPAELKEFYRKERHLLERYYENSHAVKSPVVLTSEVANAESQTAANATLLYESMLDVISRRTAGKEIMRDARTAANLPIFGQERFL